MIESRLPAKGARCSFVMLLSSNCRVNVRLTVGSDEYDASTSICCNRNAQCPLLYTSVDSARRRLFLRQRTPAFAEAADFRFWDDSTQCVATVTHLAESDTGTTPKSDSRFWRASGIRAP